MRNFLLPALTATALAFAACAQGAATAAPATTPEMLELETVTVVAGIQPGPSLWKVTRGEHLMWILGTVAPVPKKMEWVSPQADAALASAQELIGAPGFSANMGVGSMFKAAFAMPTILKARRNPGDKTLREVLPADLYARWLPLKALYLGDDGDVEKWRPIFAAGELYQAALKRSGSGVRQRHRQAHRRPGRQAQAQAHLNRDPRRDQGSEGTGEVLRQGRGR